LQSSNALSGELVTCRSSDRIVSLVSTEAILSPTPAGHKSPRHGTPARLKNRRGQPVA
jgi:hypothetical protein